MQKLYLDSGLAKPFLQISVYNLIHISKVSFLLFNAFSSLNIPNGKSLPFDFFNAFAILGTSTANPIIALFLFLIEL